MVITLIALVIICYVAVMGFRGLKFVVAARAARKVTSPYGRASGNESKHVLVLGDSTMYGAGIKNREKTIGGLLGSKYPGSSIETLAENGARTRDLSEQLAHSQHPHYELIVVGIGGNDIVKLSKFQNVEHELVVFLNTAQKRASNVILCHCVNVGNIGFFLFPLNFFFDYRTRKLSEMYAKVVSKFPNVKYVNFYRPMNDDHYDKTTRHKFIAGDAFHPNDYANEYFFSLIWDAVKKS
jgi:lysophospholipase L1-like esterase